MTCASTYTLVEDSTFLTYSNINPYNRPIYFDMIERNLAANSPGTGNPQAFYVFAKPIGGSLQCTTVDYGTMVHN